MRYVFAFTALALAAVFAILGLGQLTFLSGPPSVTAPLDPNPKLHYSVIMGDVLTSEDGQAALELRGKGMVFAGYGSQADVEAWVAPFTHEVFSLKDGEITSEIVEGVPLEPEAAANPEFPTSATDFKNPAASDLWLGEALAEENVTLYTDATENEAIIFASDGRSKQPTWVTMMWLKDASVPWFGPLMLLAGIFGVLGLLLYLIAVDRDKRGTGPQRGRRGPFRGIRDIATETVDKAKTRRAVKKDSDAAVRQDVHRDSPDERDDDVPAPAKAERSASRQRVRAMLALVALGAVLGTTGCSARFWPSFSSESVSETTAPTTTTSSETGETAPTLPPSPVTEAQLTSIVSRIAALSASADQALSEDEIKQRFVGSALAQRVANYKIRAAVEGTPPPFVITGELLDYNLIQSTEGWPRTILATTKSEFPKGIETPKDSHGKPSESPALALVLKQNSPYSNYMVHDVIEVRGGVKFPEAAAVEEGVAVLPNDTKTLLLPPNKVGIAFGQILAEGEAAPAYNKFDLTDDPLVAQMGKAWLEKSQAEAAAKGETVEYSLEMGQADDVLALSTGAGGVLVSVTVNEKHIAKSTQARGSVKLTPAVKALSGLSGSKKSVYQLWQHQMLFFVPSEGETDKIQVLGSTTAMTGAGEG